MTAVRVLPGADPMRTLHVMADAARAATLDPLVIRAAVSAVRPVPGRDSVAQVDAIRSWLVEHLEFLADPVGEPGDEVLRTPRYLLGEVVHYGYARGDCDDAAMLSAAMAKAVGLRAQFVAVAWGNPPQFRHVYSRVWTWAGWQDLDVTEPRSTPRPLFALSATLEV